MAEALAALHRLGLGHRDIKPTCIFLCDDDVEGVKLINLDAVRPVNSPRDLIVGNPTYMAPEQLLGGPIDERADLFALGGVLFQGLTGRPPHWGENISALLSKRLHEDAPRLAGLRPDVPPELDDLVARLLARDPARRPRDGAALVAELARLDFAPR